MPWIDIINGRLEQGDCSLSMTNSTTAEGWMRKSNFNKHSNDPIQASTCVNAARHNAKLFMDADIKRYVQWLAVQNNVVDALSEDWYRDDNKLTSMLLFHFPKQMPKLFKISLLPNKISLWLILLLQRQPLREQLWEPHTTTKLEPG